MNFIDFLYVLILIFVTAIMVTVVAHSIIDHKHAHDLEYLEREHRLEGE